MRWIVVLMLALAAPLAGADPRPTMCSVGVPGDRHAGLDDDRDGVVDSDDWCPDTAAGTRVGANGCADWDVPTRCDRPTPEVPKVPPKAPD